MYIRNSVLVGLLAYLFIGAVTTQAFAATENPPSCQPIYGGGKTCAQTKKVNLNQTILNPQTNKYVENLETNDPKYTPGQTVQFRVSIKNNTNNQIKNITIKNLLPNYLECVTDATGKCDNKTKTINLTIDKINKNETKTLTLKGKIVSSDKLPSNQTPICVVNQSTATYDKKSSQDNTQFCIENTKASQTSPQTTKNPSSTKGGLPVYPATNTKTTPATGPETIALISLLPTALLGLYLRKKTNS